MTLDAVLQELVQRLTREDDTIVAWEQVRDWPAGAIQAFEETGWLTRIPAATTLECPGCEHQCFMPVHLFFGDNKREPRAYVACDRRDDIGRVKIPLPRLQRWQITATQVACWIAGALGFEGQPERDQKSGRFVLGTFKGKKLLGRVEFDPADPVLRVGDLSVRLIDAMTITRGRPRLLQAVVRKLVDGADAVAPFRSVHKRRKAAGPHDATPGELGSPEWRTQNARIAANARHDRPGGSREKQRRMRELWATGNYSSRDVCAEQECAALGMSFSAARKALNNTPSPG